MPDNVMVVRPSVSVIVPAYNHAPFLKRRLDSILQQSFQDFELIVLDDASTDGTADVIAGYLPHPRIRFVPSRVNSGSAFVQWGRGIELARGTYLWIAESDDWADPRFLQRLVDVLERHPDVGLAYCQSWAVDAADQVIGNAQCWTEELDPQRWQSDFVAHGRDEVRRFLIDRNTIPNASAVLMRRRAFDAAGPMDTGFRLCGDWMLWIRILAASDVAFVSESLNFWRLHTSHSRAASNGTLEWLEGERVVREAARAAGLSEADTEAALFKFLRKCWQWQREYIERQEPSGAREPAQIAEPAQTSQPAEPVDADPPARRATPPLERIAQSLRAALAPVSIRTGNRRS